jgi:protein-disulfide isomerase
MNKINHYFKTIIKYIKRIKLTTPVAILLGAIIISAGIVSYGFITRTNTIKTKDTTFAGKVIGDNEPVEGKESSKVIVMEYSDPECPFCILVYPTLKQIRTEYAGKIEFVYRHFPLSDKHPNAFNESKAIICSGKVGGSKKYFEYMDALFGYKVPKQNQENSSPQLPVAGRQEIALGLGLDGASFSSCMSEKQTDNEITTSYNDGITAGVQGTPTTFILIKNKKGYEVVALVDGARPYEYFKAAIDEALSR